MESIKHVNHMTDKEKRIVKFLSDGLTADEISKQMSLAKKTIEFILYRLRIRHGCSNTTHLVAMMIRKKEIK